MFYENCNTASTVLGEGLGMERGTYPVFYYVTLALHSTFRYSSTTHVLPQSDFIHSDMLQPYKSNKDESDKMDAASLAFWFLPFKGDLCPGTSPESIPEIFQYVTASTELHLCGGCDELIGIRVCKDEYSP